MPGRTISGVRSVYIESACSYWIAPPAASKRPVSRASEMKRCSARVRSRRAMSVGLFSSVWIEVTSPETVGAAGG